MRPDTKLELHEKELKKLELQKNEPSKLELHKLEPIKKRTLLVDLGDPEELAMVIMVDGP